MRAWILALALLPGCGVRYVVQSGYYQAELLLSRRKVEKVLAEGGLAAGEEQRLRLIPELKAFGKTLGLENTRNYSSVAIGWKRGIWTVQACEPLAFEPRTWWFPIVGRVPYLGFFREDEAVRWEERLAAEGLDVHRRAVGAYSTLGWFRDPVLPGMLRWDEADLAETVFHELAHATLWIPGSVAFNESFASVVGEEGARRWLAATGSAELAAWERDDRDWRRFEALLWGVYRDLDTVYADPALDEIARGTRKAAILASIPDRIQAAGLEAPDRWLRSARRIPWNNARLMQFKHYNSNDALFAAVLDRNGGDLRAFIDDIGKITRGRRDPFVALADAVGVRNL